MAMSAVCPQLQWSFDRGRAGDENSLKLRRRHQEGIRRTVIGNDEGARRPALNGASQRLWLR